MTQLLVVLTNAPDEATAQDIAARLVEYGLAACVNVLSPCRSVYRWQGAMESTQEVPLLIKTTPARYAEVQAAIVAAHPFEVPEIIALPVGDGLPAYLDWVASETAAPR